MGLSFVQPALLFLLLLLIPLWGIAIAGRMIVRASTRGRAVAAWRVWTSLLIRTVILAALVLALAGTQLVRAAPAMTTVFILDSSDSISPPHVPRARPISPMLCGVCPKVTAPALWSLEKTPSWSVRHPLIRALVRITQVPDGSATDIGRALQLGMAALPADSRRRIMLLSDGAETSPTALEAALQAQAAAYPHRNGVTDRSRAGGRCIGRGARSPRLGT